LLQTEGASIIQALQRNQAWLQAKQVGETRTNKQRAKKPQRRDMRSTNKTANYFKARESIQHQLYHKYPCRLKKMPATMKRLKGKKKRTTEDKNGHTLLIGYYYK